MDELGIDFAMQDAPQNQGVVDNAKTEDTRVAQREYAIFNLKMLCPVCITVVISYALALGAGGGSGGGGGNDNNPPTGGGGGGGDTMSDLEARLQNLRRND